jgi:branched-chain amino acid transport system ATP-binding protein
MTVLSIKDLYVSYGHIAALNGISLEVNEGQMVSIIGSNGAGKSTLINTISGIVKPKSGIIEFLGKRLPVEPHKIVKAGITQVPEGRKVFAGLTVEENLVAGGIVKKVSETRQMEKKMYEMFPILKDRRGQQAGTLSGGEQQMLAIARGLMPGPKLLLLDEPSLGLAPIIVTQVFSLIDELRNMGYTIMLIEQNALKAMRYSDYTYVLENGVIKKQGPSKELLDDPRIIEAYLGEKAEEIIEEEKQET